MAEQVVDILTDEFEDPKPGLREKDRARLDSIVMKMRSNKESDDNIKMVVEDFKKKYSVPDPTRPEAAPQIDFNKPFFGMVPEITGAPEVTAENVLAGSSLKKKANAGLNTFVSEISSPENMEARKRMMQSDRYKEYQARMPLPISDMPQSGASQTADRLNLGNPKEQDFEVTTRELSDELKRNLEDPRSARKFVAHVIKEQPQKAAKIQQALYDIDILSALPADASAIRRMDKITANSKKIAEGKLKYDVQTGTLYEPQGFVKSVISGHKEKTKGFSDFDFITFAPKEDVIKEYEKRRADYDPDKPVEIPEGKLAEMGQMAAGTPLKPIVAAVATSLIPGAQAATPVVAGAVGGAEYFRLTKAQTFRDVYNALRDKGVPESEAYEEAMSAGNKAGAVDAANAAVMSAVGARIGLRAMPKSAVTPGFRAAAVDFLKRNSAGIGKDVLEGLAGGVTGAGSQAVKNWVVGSAGVSRQMDEGVADAFTGNLLFTVGLAAAIKGGQGLSSIKYRSILNGLKKADPEAVGKTLKDWADEGRITQEQSDRAQSEIEQFKEADAKIPQNISDEARLKIQDKIKRRDELQKGLEETDKAFHPEIKEKIAKIEEEISELAKDRVKADPMERRAQKAVDAAVTDGKLNDVYSSIAKKDPVGFVEMIRDQIYGKNSDGSVSLRPDAEVAVREQLGDDLVDAVKEMYDSQMVRGPKEYVAQGRSVMDGSSSFTRFLPEEQQGFRDAGEVNSEASVMLSKEEYSADKQKELIEEFAKDRGVWFGNIRESYGKPDKTGLEADVWIDKDKKVVTKAQGVFAYGDVQKTLDGIVLHNSIFPEAKIKVIGFGKTPTGAIEIIVEQPLVEQHPTKKITQDQIDEYMASKGFEINKVSGNYKNKNTLIADITPNNVMITPDEQIVVFDSTPKLRRTQETGRASASEVVSNEASEKPRINTSFAGVRNVKLKSAKEPVSFKTSKGSTYTVNENGGTTRNKAARDEAGHEGDSGVKEPSKKTWYVSEEDLGKLSEIAAKGKYKKEIAEMPDGNIGVRYIDGPDAGKFEKRTVVTPKTDPEVGLHPVEIWDDGHHFGNKITEILKQEPDAIQVKSAEEVPVAETSADSEKVGEGISGAEEPAGTRIKEESATVGDEKVIPPTVEEGDVNRLAHADTEEIYQLIGKKERVPKPTVTDIDLEKQADDLIRSGYDFDGKAGAVISGEDKGFSGVEQVAFAKAVGALKAKLEKTPINDPAFYDIQDRIEFLSRASDMAGSTMGFDLRSRRMFVNNPDSLSDMITRKKEATGEANLTPEQTEQVKKQRDKIKEKEKSLSDKGKELADKIRALRPKTDKTQSNIFGLPLAVYDTAIVTIANAVEAGAKLADAIQAGVKYVKENGGFKTKKDELDFIAVMKGQATNDERLGAYKKRTKKSIDEIKRKTAEGEFEKADKSILELDEEAQKLKDEYREARAEFETAIERDKLARRSTREKVVDYSLEPFRAIRTIKASMDFSAPLRQGFITTISHPGVASKAAAQMFKQAFSKKAFNRWLADLKESPAYQMMEKSGLYIADPNTLKLAAKEEQFMSNLAEKIPVIGSLIKGSERAYVAYLNKMRADIFQQGVAAFEAEGKTFQNSRALYEGLANYINNATGRGGLGKLEPAAQTLNTVFFSPRLMASRMNILGLSDIATGGNGFYSKLPKEVRVMAIKDLAKVIVFGMSILGLSKIAGAEVEPDPRSSDFGKIKVGNTRWDIWGGFQPYVRLVSQLLSGQTKSTKSGEVKDLNTGKMFGATRGDKIGSFFRGKLAPVPSSIVDILYGKDVVGKEATVASELKESFIPMIYTDVQEAMKDQGVAALFSVGVPSMFGVSSQTYDSKSPSGKSSTTKKENSKERNKGNNKKD